MRAASLHLQTSRHQKLKSKFNFVKTTSLLSCLLSCEAVWGSHLFWPPPPCWGWWAGTEGSRGRRAAWWTARRQAGWSGPAVGATDCRSPGSTPGRKSGAEQKHRDKTRSIFSREHLVPPSMAGVGSLLTLKGQQVDLKGLHNNLFLYILIVTVVACIS